MAHRRSFVSRGRPSSSKTWVPLAVNNGGVAYNLTSVSPAQVAVGTPGEADATVLRTFGTILVYMEADLSTSVGTTVGFGMGITTKEAGAALAVPLPLTDQDWDGWYVHKVFQLTTNSLGPDQPNIHRWDIDSKAMRRIQAQNVFFMAVEVVDAGGATLNAAKIVRATLQGRTLLKVTS